VEKFDIFRTFNAFGEKKIDGKLMKTDTGLRREEISFYSLKYRQELFVG
jgi:hypothetical protein